MYGLSHRGQDKMVAIFADDILKLIFFNEKYCIYNKISLKHVHKGSVDDKPAWVLIMTWRLTGFIWTNNGLVRWHINASLGLDEL